MRQFALPVLALVALFAFGAWQTKSCTAHDPVGPMIGHAIKIAGC